MKFSIQIYYNRNLVRIIYRMQLFIVAYRYKLNNSAIMLYFPNYYLYNYPTKYSLRIIFHLQKCTLVYKYKLINTLHQIPTSHFTYMTRIKQGTMDLTGNLFIKGLNNSCN